MTAVPDAVRREARVRAGMRCEYCRLPDSEGEHPFHIEHIISRKHGGASSLENLAWSCFPCNSAKGPDIGANDPLTGKLTSLFNPREQQWHDHFELADGEILGKTAVGRATIVLLRVNSQKQIALRRKLHELGQW